MPSNQTRKARLKAGLTGLLKGLWSEKGSLGQKAVRGAFWTLSGEWASRGLTMVQTIVLVRLLVPADFGIMRIGGFLLALMTRFTETGMGAAIIQRKDLDTETINTAWTINVMRNLGLYVAVWLVAPWGARFYENPLICPILRVLGLKLVLDGFQNIGLTLLKKDLNFRTRQLLDIVTIAVSVLITVVAGFILRSVWAIVIGQVALSAMRVVGSYIIHPYRPRLRLHAREVRRLFAFGLNLTGSAILVFLSTQGDDAVVGKVVGMSGLGFYALAYGLSNLPVYCITRVLSAVAFPVYSRVQHDGARLATAFATVLRAVTVLVLPAGIGLYLIAPGLVRVVYGENYLPMLACFRILVAYGVLRALAATIGPVFVAVGKPELNLRSQIVRTLVLAITIVPATAIWGISGAAASTVLSMFSCTVWGFWRVSRLLHAWAPTTWLGEVCRAVPALVVMSLLVVPCAHWSVTDSPLGMIATVALAITAYGAVLLGTWPDITAEVRTMARKAMS